MTPEEWREATNGLPPGTVWWPAEWRELEGVASRHTIAALCLHGQPFGFNPVNDIAELNPPAGSIVEALRDTAAAIDRACGSTLIGVVHVTGPGGSAAIGAYYAEQFRACASVIAALLPPENP